jgi:preprotein translocase subunit SecG
VGETCQPALLIRASWITATTAGEAAFSASGQFSIISTQAPQLSPFAIGKDITVAWLAPFLNVILILLGLFLILLVLIQRGKGGGLVGALSGVGGSSPFGSRAGDTFTRVTIYAACIWLLLTMVQVRAIQSNAGQTREAPIGPSGQR